MCFAIGCGGKNVKNFVCPGLIVSLWQDVCIESVYAPRLCSLTQVRLRLTRLPVLHVQTYRWLTHAHTRAHGARATGSRKHSFFRAFTYRLSHLQTRVCAPPDGDKHSHELVNPALCWVAGSRSNSLTPREGLVTQVNAAHTYHAAWGTHSPDGRLGID